MTILEDRHFVGDPLDLFHSVRYIDDDLAFRFQLCDDLKQSIDLWIGKGCCRLIKADYLQILSRICLHDLDHLLVSDTQIFDFCRRVDRKTKIFNDLWCHLVCFLGIDESKTVDRHSSEINILCDRKFQKNLTFLIDNGDSFFDCLMRGLEMFFHTVQQIFSACRLIISIQHFQKCGFPRSVLSKECQNLACICLKRNIIQCFYTREIFTDVLKFQHTAHIAFLPFSLSFWVFSFFVLYRQSLQKIIPIVPFALFILYYTCFPIIIIITVCCIVFKSCSHRFFMFSFLYKYFKLESERRWRIMQLSDKFFTFDTGEKSRFFDIITSSGL